MLFTGFHDKGMADSQLFTTLVSGAWPKRGSSWVHKIGRTIILAKALTNEVAHRSRRLKIEKSVDSFRINHQFGQVKSSAEFGSVK